MPVQDPHVIISQFFPAEILNFDTPPPGTIVGPLHAIFTAAGQAVAQHGSDQLQMQAQVAVQSAAGPYLDMHGVLYGVARMTGEIDTPYRARILAAIKFGRLTIAAIAAAVNAYYASQILVSGALAPTVTVYDLQSNPTLGSILGLQLTDFVIDIAFNIPASKLFWAGRSYAGRSYVKNLSGFSLAVPDDLGLVAVVTRNKSAGTYPIWRTHENIVGGI